MTAPVRLIVFPGGFNWPVWVAQRHGFFERRGVALELMTTPGSVFQWTTLADPRISYGRDVGPYFPLL